jgi:hypothetical protein
MIIIMMWFLRRGYVKVGGVWEMVRILVINCGE